MEEWSMVIAFFEYEIAGASSIVNARNVISSLFIFCGVRDVNSGANIIKDGY